jgi:SAM-dependent methyltransferase
MEAGRPSPEHAEALRGAVRAKYRAVARRPGGHFPYPVGRESAVGLGYRPEWLEAVPDEVVTRFVGVGHPLGICPPRPGQRVLDLGCGSGLDVFVAGLLTGPAGRAVGVDLTPEMVALPLRHSASTENLEFHAARIEALPFEDESFDLATSNGALNLVPDKDDAFTEIFRVLRRGSRLAVADLLLTDTLPPEALADLDAWST